MLFVMIYASICSSAVNTDGWYALLAQPKFNATLLKSLIICIYIAEIICIAKLFYLQKWKQACVLIAGGIFYCLWCFVFFSLHSLFISFIIYSMMIIYSVIALELTSKSLAKLSLLQLGKFIIFLVLMVYHFKISYLN